MGLFTSDRAIAPDRGRQEDKKTSLREPTQSDIWFGYNKYKTELEQQQQQQQASPKMTPYSSSNNQWRWRWQQQQPRRLQPPIRILARHINNKLVPRNPGDRSTLLKGASSEQEVEIWAKRKTLPQS